MDFKLKKNNLNFRVYTAAALPDAGRENDICIISDVPMPNWILSPDKPVEAPRNDGDVWIRYSVKGNVFNALKNDSLLIAAISAKQYVDGVWVDVTAKSCRNGAWVDWWTGHLYEYGDQYEDITGGWSANGYIGKGYTHLQATINSDSIYIWGTNGVGPGGIGTVNKIDLSGRTKLHILADVGSANTAHLGIVANKSDDILHSTVKQVSLPSGTSQTATLDISDIAEGYIAVYSTSGTYIYEVWLE